MLNRKIAALAGLAAEDHERVAHDVDHVDVVVDHELAEQALDQPGDEEHDDRADHHRAALPVTGRVASTMAMAIPSLLQAG
mgnify:CR=1 FL=1